MGFFHTLGYETPFSAKESVVFDCQSDWDYYVAAIQKGGSYENQPCYQNLQK